MAEGTASTGSSHASLPWETALAERDFSKERASVGLIWALLDGLSTTWLPSKMWWSHLRTQDQLGPLKAAVFSGIGVKQKPVEAELSLNQEGDVALPLCSRLEDVVPDH